jgi:hypothetical protein
MHFYRVSGAGWPFVEPPGVSQDLVTAEQTALGIVRTLNGE